MGPGCRLDDSCRDTYCLLTTGRMVTLAGNTMLIPSDQDEWPDCVVGYELVWGSGGQLRFVCAARFEWVRDRMAQVRDVNLKRLCGGNLSGRVGGGDDDTGSVITEGDAPVDERSKSISDARERYLQRKKQKQ